MNSFNVYTKYVYKNIVYKNIGTYISVYREPNVLRIHISKFLISSETYIKQFTIFLLNIKELFTRKYRLYTIVYLMLQMEDITFKS